MFITFLQTIYQNTLTWFADHGIAIAGIIVGALILRKISDRVIDKIVRKAVVSDHFLTKEAELKRENTLVRVFTKTLSILIWVFAILMILSETGVNIGALLVGAGVAGLAVGFGGQYLIRDVISGLFIIFENQFRVGDVVCLDGTCGLVEDITLRSTILRDLDGTVHHVPNGEIKKTSNLSKHFARIHLNVGVSYSTDLDHVIGVINKVGKELAQDPTWKDNIIKAPQFFRVEDFADSAVIIKILGETKPLKQWDATSEFRKRLKIAFDKEGIEIPFPQRVIHYAQEK